MTAERTPLSSECKSSIFVKKIIRNHCLCPNEVWNREHLLDDEVHEFQLFSIGKNYFYQQRNWELFEFNIKNNCVTIREQTTNKIPVMSFSFSDIWILSAVVVGTNSSNNEQPRWRFSDFSQTDQHFSVQYKKVDNASYKARPLGREWKLQAKNDCAWLVVVDTNHFSEIYRLTRMKILFSFFLPTITIFRLGEN